MAQAVGGAVATVNSNKYYLEQQLIPMQVYMDDIDAFLPYLTDTQRCRLNTIEHDYRVTMGFDRYVRVKVGASKYLLFRNKRMQFEQTAEMTQCIQRLIGTSVPNTSAPVLIYLTPGDNSSEPGIQFTFTEYADTSRTRLSAAYFDNPKDPTHTHKYTLTCRGDDGTELWFRNYKRSADVLEDLRPLLLCKHMQRVYIQTYDTTRDETQFGDFTRDSETDIYKWVEASCVYRGVYRPLSPVRCNHVQTCKMKRREWNNDGWNMEALKAVFDAWNNVEYLYLALKSMFEEIVTLRTLQMDAKLQHVHNALAVAKSAVSPSPVPHMSEFKTFVSRRI